MDIFLFRSTLLNTHYRLNLQDNRVITDNSFVVTHDEFRTVYDSGLDFEKTKDIIQDTFRKISGNIENKQTIPSLIYLCKWYLEEYNSNQCYFCLLIHSLSLIQIHHNQSKKQTGILDSICLKGV